MLQIFPSFFMKPEGPLPYSQEPANSPYPDPDKSSPNLHPSFNIVAYRSVARQRPRISKYTTAVTEKRLRKQKHSYGNI
jgi:hypothetical protein